MTRAARRRRPFARRRVRSASPGASPSRRLDGSNRRAHHAVPFSLGPLVAEADLLEEGARGAIEELGPHLLALQVVRIALHHAAARLGDQIEGSANRDPCNAFLPVVPVDEDARDAIGGRLPRETGLPFLAVIEPRKLLRSAVLSPGHRCVAVEDESGARFPLASETLLPGAALLALGPALTRVEPRAPAAAEPAPVVLLDEARERIPRRGVERPDLVLAHGRRLSQRRQSACGFPPARSQRSASGRSPRSPAPGRSPDDRRSR